jgi:hypothetical protein
MERELSSTISKEAVEAVQGMLLEEADGIQDERPEYAAGLKRAAEKLSFELRASDGTVLVPYPDPHVTHSTS